jgi:protein-disulfide isomerase
MALKDRLTEALKATPPENSKRLTTLRAVEAASGGGSDGEMQSAITALIGEREQMAASFAAAGQSDQARAERAEIDALRHLLRSAAPPPEAPKKTAAAKSATAKPAAKKTEAHKPDPEAEVAPLLSRNQILMGLGAIAVGAGGYIYYRNRTGSSATTTAAATHPIVVRPDDHTLGNPRSNVILLEYAAPTCPFCAHFNETVLQRIKTEYIETGKIFYIFRTFPINPTDGAVEALARKCLPADKYFRFLDLMFRNQDKWDPDGHQIDDVHGAVVQMARIMGISPADADRCMTDKQELERINQVAADAVNTYNIHSTPTLILNGTVVEGTEATWEGLKAKIETLLAKR